MISGAYCISIAALCWWCGCISITNLSYQFTAGCSRVVVMRRNTWTPNKTIWMIKRRASVSYLGFDTAVWIRIYEMKHISKQAKTFDHQPESYCKLSDIFESFWYSDIFFQNQKIAIVLIHSHVWNRYRYIYTYLGRVWWDYMWLFPCQG